MSKKRLAGNKIIIITRDKKMMSAECNYLKGGWLTTQRCADEMKHQEEKKDGGDGEGEG